MSPEQVRALVRGITALFREIRAGTGTQGS
jgi:hypothetical protein